MAKRSITISSQISSDGKTLTMSATSGVLITNSIFVCLKLTANPYNPNEATTKFLYIAAPADLTLWPEAAPDPNNPVPKFRLSSVTINVEGISNIAGIVGDLLASIQLLVAQLNDQTSLSTPSVVVIS